MTNRAVYLAPDYSEPAGGMRAIYRHAELLVEAGHEAVVWHCAADFTCDWFTSSAPVVSGTELRLDDSDVLIVPEVMVNGTDPAPGCRKVIFNQNHFYTFDNVATDGYPGWTPRPLVWTSSTTSLDVLRRMHRELPVELVPYSVDLEVFRPRPRHGRKVIWMPRKRPRESALLGTLLRADDRFDGVELTKIDGLSEERTADELGTATVFVALGHEEGFGLPVLEALASGCPVVGYPAGGGSELFTAPGTHAVADADLVAIVERVAALLAAEPSDDERSGYRSWVEANYPGGVQRDRLMEAIEAARERPGAAGVATHPISRLQLGPSVGELAERVEELTGRLAELTTHTTELTTQLETERSGRERMERVASILESDLERSLRELDRGRREVNLFREELRDLRDERTELRAAIERLANLEEVTALLSEYKQDNDRLNVRLDNEIRHAHDLENSTSWRFTAPMRWVSGTVRGERRG